MALSTHWVNHIEAWQHTGLRQSVYCREQNLNYNTFSARLSDYRKAQTQTLPTLIPVQVEVSSVESIVLKHAKGHHVDPPVSISAAWLAELLRCLD